MHIMQHFIFILLLQAINNYSLTVAQGEASKKAPISPTSQGSGDAKVVGVANSSHSSEHSATKVYVYEGLLGTPLFDLSVRWFAAMKHGVV